jgi:uncharacterized membrane protein YbhN (UPF0104 family)
VTRSPDGAEETCDELTAQDTQDAAAAALHDAHRLRNGLVWTVALVLLIVAAGLAVPGLHGVVKRAAHADIAWLAAGVGLEVLSCLGYVLTVRLVLNQGPPREVRRLAWAEMAFGAVVPAGGAGGLAVGAWAMRAWDISWSRIVDRSAVIFLLTSAVNVIVLALAGLGLAAGVGGTNLSVLYGVVPAVIGVGCIAFFALLPRIPALRSPSGSGRITRILVRASGWVQATEFVGRERDWRLVGTIGYLLFDMAVLWACLRAVGRSVPLLPLSLGYQIGYLANLVPIPGGVGALEGGIVGALVLYGFPAAPTAAAVVLYHAIALWIPTIGGTVSFALIRRAVAAGPPSALVNKASPSAPGNGRV